MHCLYVSDIPRSPVIIHWQCALLAEQHCEVKLGKLLLVPVVTIADVLVERAIGWNAGDIVAEIVVFQHLIHPCREKRLRCPVEMEPRISLILDSWVVLIQSVHGFSSRIHSGLTALPGRRGNRPSWESVDSLRGMPLLITLQALDASIVHQGSAKGRQSLLLQYEQVHSLG